MTSEPSGRVTSEPGGRPGLATSEPGGPARPGLVGGPRRHSRLVLGLAFIAAGCIAYLPYVYLPSAEPLRTGLWLTVAAGLLGASLVARRSSLWQPYWRVVYALFIGAFTGWADTYVTGWIARFAGVEAASPAGYALGSLENALVVTACVVGLTLLSGADLASLLLQRGRARWWLPIGLGAMLFFAVTAVPAATDMFRGQGLTPDRLRAWAPWILLFVLANGLREELWFRGLLVPQVTPHLGAVGATLTTSVVFALAHITETYTPQLLLFLGMTFGLSLLFTTIALRTKSLWGAVLVHAGADIPIIVGIMSGL